MIIKDKLIHPYIIDISNKNVTVEELRVSNKDDDSKESNEYTTNEGSFSSVGSALKKIDRLKQESFKGTIDLAMYIKGLENKTKAYENLLKNFDYPNISRLFNEIESLNKKVSELTTIIDNMKKSKTYDYSQ